MRVWTAVLSLLLVGTICLGLVDAAPNELETTPSAAALADPARWRFVGCEAYKSEELREALAANLDVIVATRSAGTVDQLIAAVTRQLTLGYQSVGYHEATVSADVDAGTKQLIVTVHEGRLSRQGKVEVRGATTINVGQLAQEVTQKYAPADAIPVFQGSAPTGEAPLTWIKPNGQPEKLNDAIWNPGQPAPFVPSIWKTWEPLIHLMLNRHGYSEPALSVSVEPVEDGTATLVITVKAEGPRVALGEIEVTGNERNSTEEILNYLQLKPGMPFDSMQQARVNWQLRQSARFLKHDVQLIAPTFDEPSSRLRLTLVEAPRVPMLNEPFTEIQQVAIRAAHWMSTQREYDWEISTRLKTNDKETSLFWKELLDHREIAGRYILSPCDQAAMFELGVTETDGSLVWGQVLSASREAAWLLAPHRRAKLEWSGIKATLLLQIALNVQPPNKEGHMSHLSFGMGANSKQDHDGQPIRCNLTFVPLATILEATKETNRVELTDERMTIRGEEKDGVTTFEMVVEAKTGRLITWHTDWEGNRFEIRTVKGLYAEAVSKWRPVRDDSKNQLHAGAPVTSLLQYMADEARSVEKLQSQRLPAWFRMAERLVASGALRPLDDAITKSSGKDHSPTPFAIPVEPNPKSPLGALAWLDPVLRAALPFYAKVCPRETPGWTIGREATLMLLQPKGVPIPSPFGVSLMLEEAHAGPLHFLMAARLFGYFSAGHRVVLANGGLNELSAASFRRDIAAIMNDKGAVSKMANVLAQLLRELDEPDLDDLAEMFRLAPNDRAAVTSLLQELTRRRDEPADILLPELAEQAWPVIQPRIEAALRELAVPSAPPSRTPPRVAEQPHADKLIKSSLFDQQSPNKNDPSAPNLPPPPTRFKPQRVEEPIVPTISPKVGGKPQAP